MTSMNVFISWSGPKSGAIAELVYLWLPKVIQAVKPFYSPEIEKGTRSIEEINSSLEGMNVGIICLTPDNRESPWIHFEAGALAKTKDARIWTLLHGLEHSDVLQPLAQFQHTVTSFPDMSILLKSINLRLAVPLDVRMLEDAIEKWWPDFENKLRKIDEKFDRSPEPDESQTIRPDRDVLNEILDIVRSIRKPAISAKLSALPRLSDRPQFIKKSLSQADDVSLNSADDDIPF